MSGHQQLAEAMRRMGQTPGYAYSLPRQATISSYDPNAYAVKVMLQPENIESNWMPLGALAVGNGWGIVAAPQIGDQVQVVFAEGDFHSGVVVARVFSTQAAPPVVQAGEMLLRHSSGSFIRFNADGSISSSGTWNHTGTLNASVDVIGGGKSLKTHVHGGVQPGGSNTGAPV